MNREEMIEDFNAFLRDNQDIIKDRIQRIEDIPEDDEWFMEDEWDEIYEREVKKNIKREEV